MKEILIALLPYVGEAVTALSLIIVGLIARRVNRRSASHYTRRRLTRLGLDRRIINDISDAIEGKKKTPRPKKK